MHVLKPNEVDSKKFKSRIFNPAKNLIEKDLGVFPRKGVGGVLFWSSLHLLKDGSYGSTALGDHIGKTPEQMAGRLVI
jgi:hypothetical protein